MKSSFEESQKFNQWWLYALLGLSTIISLGAFYKQIIQGEPLGDKPMPNIALIITVIFFFSLVVLFLVMKLKTRIDHAGIHFQFVPFTNRSITWDEIKSAEVLNYGFVGGWGIRIWTRYGTVYNIRGNKGLAIDLKNGKKLLLGTQQEEELRQVVSEYWPTNSN